MSRYDHTDPKMGTYRATLAADTISGDLEKLYGIGHDANGRLVIGAGQTGIVAVWVATKLFRAGKRVDPMTTGQIVEFGPTIGNPGVDFGIPGTVYYSDSSGLIIAGNDEIQTVTVTSSGSPFTVSWNGQGPTSSLSGSTTTAAQLQAALEALSNINPGDVSVSGSAGGPYAVRFMGQYVATDVPQMTGSNATVATTAVGDNTTGLVRVGHTTEKDRLQVRVRP